MNKREITSRIYLTGTKPGTYTAVLNGFDGNFDIQCNTARAGHAIVRALREEAVKRPDLFPVSKWPSGVKP